MSRTDVRILHVTDSFLPTVGGIEVHVGDLLTRQRAAGHDADVLTHGTDGRLVVHTAALTHPLSLAAAVDGRYDVIHVHASVCSPLAWRAALAASRAGVPTVVTAHSLLDGVVPLYRGATAVLRLRSRPIVWSAVSRVAAASLAAGLGIPAGQVLVLPNAVDDTWCPPRPPAAATDGVPAGPVVFVAVMRLARRKRLDALLTSFRAARVDGRARLVIAGDGPRAAAARRWCGRHQDVDVTLLGARRREEVRALLADADVFLAPATRESFGIAALEARTVGLPVVARRGTGVADFVTHGRHGLLVGSDEEMAQAIRLLARDGELRARLARGAAAERPRYDWDRASSAADEAYTRAAQAAGARSAVTSLGPRPTPAR